MADWWAICLVDCLAPGPWSYVYVWALLFHMYRPRIIFCNRPPAPLSSSYYTPPHTKTHTCSCTHTIHVIPLCRRHADTRMDAERDKTRRHATHTSAGAHEDKHNTTATERAMTCSGEGRGWRTLSQQITLLSIQIEIYYTCAAAAAAVAAHRESTDA